jgi:hypothetical protein
MFLAEEGTRYTADFFVAINVDCERSYTYEKNLELFLTKYNESAIKALKELVDLFENTDRTLYIGFGFKESDQLNEEEILEELLGGNCATQEEVLKGARIFPDWYDKYAKTPEELQFITVKAERYIEEVLKPMEKVSLENKLNEILQKEDLKSSDKELLKTIANHLAN